ncbi:MAG TPA: DUF1553 domain-containing protein [Bacteroidia bacterium]|nr:DUF1553 domain-containing protein [Bacteroidia bacterium]
MTPSGHAQKRTVAKFAGISALLLALASPLAADEAWSLRPLVRPTPPASGNPIDAFIHAALAEKGLRQNDSADPHTLRRRMTLDLTGLPPTREEIRNPESDIRALIDRLLDSPHYGERWGRHWLDVARYVQGTIKVPGVAATDLAEPYRDYVVRSFNEDKPYDRFFTEQLAGDLLSIADESEAARQDRLVAPAFLSIGQWFDECTDPNKLRLDLVDEQISTATRAFLAMDFACARCHDHKFDPVSIRDYYALAGIFRSTEITSHFADEWKDGRPRALRPLASQTEIDRVAEIDRSIAALRDERFRLLAKARERLLASTTFPKGPEIPDTILAFEAEDFDGHKDLKTIPLGDSGGEAIASRRRIEQWVRYRFVLPEPGRYTLLVRYAATDPAPVALEIEGQIVGEPVLGDATLGETPDHFRWEAVSLGDLPKGRAFVRFKAAKNAPFPVIDRFLLVKGDLASDAGDWRQRLGPPSIAETRFFLDETERAEATRIESELAALAQSRPDLPLALAVTDADAPIDLAVHPGGDVYATKGDPVPRGVPSLATDLIGASFPVEGKASGRVQFAQWLAHPDHPLTARVMANRIWHWHFGTGLVRTTDDFGKQGSPPSHPELLDWLACELIESGWSVKHLHRLILGSATYQASSARTPENLAKDPDGTLLSRFPARRLEVEAIYDGMLASIGKVSRQPTGTPLDTAKSKDRALYILTSSRSPLGLGVEIRKMFPLFGFDDTGRPMHDRDESVTPAQALWWLNNPLPRHYATKLAEKLVAAEPDPAARALALHETVLGRPPGPEASAAMLAYAADLGKEGLSETEAWTRVALGLFSSRRFTHLE